MITTQELSILRHTIGFDDGGNDLYPHARSLDERRNHYVSSDSGEDFKACQRLVELSLMASHGASKLACGPTFSVTSAGREVVLANKPPIVKLTRSQRRYRYYRECCDCFESFRHFLAYEKRQREAGKSLSY